MENFWDSSVWGTYLVIGLLLLSLLAGNILKRKIRLLQESLIPTSVLGGALLLIISSIYKVITGNNMFDAVIFAGRGTATMEILTYHCLAMGFIASSFKTSENKLTKQRTVEIFNTGVTTVATYLLQAVVGFGITIIAAFIIKDFSPAAGVLLPFGYGQGTGQALNYGGIYENEWGFVGGKSFGLTIAALGFLSAAIGGVFHLNIRKKRGKLNLVHEKHVVKAEEIESANEIPMQESIDKMTVQVALIAAAYLMTYILMYLLGLVIPGMKSVIYGFNFLLGVLSATLMKMFLNWLRKSGIGHQEYVNNFLMTRTSNFFFDLMVVAGVAAIRLDTLEQY